MRRISPARLMVVVMLALVVGEAYPQVAPGSAKTSAPQVATPAESAAAAVPDQVDVEPLAQDDEISGRLANIMKATGWFDSVEVRVEDGVVFLAGTTEEQEHKEWITQLARRTQDVVAVVNQIRVNEGPFWDLSPAWGELRSLSLNGVQALPLLIVAGTLLVLGWFGAQVAVRLSRLTFERRMGNRLLREVASKAVAIPVFLIFMYIALRVSGMTQLAATVLGGTGLLGLVIGIAFRDIAENYLASILISMQRPFSMGDRIEVAGFDGFVQSVTTRGTQRRSR